MKQRTEDGVTATRTLLRRPGGGVGGAIFVVEERWTCHNRRGR